MTGTEVYMGDKPYVFVSYSRKDARLVEKFLKTLNEYRYWYDQQGDSIPGGTKWENYIINRAEHASYFLFFISKKSAQSPHCAEECAIAAARKIPIFFVYLENIDSILAEEELGWLRGKLSQYQAVWYTNNAALLEELKKNKPFRECKKDYNDIFDYRKYTHQKKSSVKKSANTGKKRLLFISSMVLLLAAMVFFGLYIKSCMKKPKTLESGRIIQVAAGEKFSAFLTSKKRVVVTGDTSLLQDVYKEWRDIDKIAAKGSRIVGITSDGKLVSTLNSETKKCQEWKDIVDVTLTKDDIFAITKDGNILSTTDSNAYKVLTKGIEVSKIDGGLSDNILLLDKQGNLTLNYKNKKTQPMEVDHSKTIVEIACGANHCVWLYDDGTVGSFGAKNGTMGEYNVSSWKDVIDIAAGDHFTIGLKKDGTLCSCGTQEAGQRETSTWKDICDIDAGRDFTIAAGTNGSVFAIGNNEYNQCEVSLVQIDATPIEEIEEFAQKGDARALRILGMKYLYGSEIDKDTRKAFTYFEASAEKGDHIAKSFVGTYYYDGMNGAVDKEKAKELFTEAVATIDGSARAEYYLGMMYENGDESAKIEKNLDTAMERYKRAADQGSVSGAYRLGKLALKSNENNQYDARYYLKYASERGSGDAQLELGHLYYKDEYDKHDYYMSRIWFKMAYDNGKTEAARYLGYFYANGYDVEADGQKAIMYYKAAVEAGDDYGAYGLGNLYLNGNCVEKNFAEALSWYKLLLEKENYYTSDAEYYSGLIYLYGGYGVEKNEAEALKFFERAAKYDEPKAWYKLGYMYYYGLGMEKEDKATAKEWLQKAVDKNNQEAIDFLKEHYDGESSAA